MKKILLSVRPKWCELIFSGKKKIEVRKDKPLQVQVPFEVLVWCTKGKYSIIQNIHTPTIKANGLYKLPNGTIQNGWEGNTADYHKVGTGPRLLHGGIIGSFTCDAITRYEGEFWDDDTYERIQEPYEPSDFAEYGEYEYDTIGENGVFCGKGIELSKLSCLSWHELRNYVGQGLKDFYGWHISETRLFDTPRPLSEFRKSCGKTFPCGRCGYSELVWNNGEKQFDYVCKRPSLTRPPQSWCYVEED